MRYKGICQCGHVAFEVEDDGPGPVACGTRSPDGTLLWRVPRDRLRRLDSAADIGAYTFSGRLVGHRFCATCGVHLYGEELGSEGLRMAYVNRDCIGPADSEAAPTPLLA